MIAMLVAALGRPAGGTGADARPVAAARSDTRRPGASPPVVLPGACSPADSTPAQMVVFGRIFALRPMAGLQSATLLGVRDRGGRVEARWRLGGYDTEVRYALARPGSAPEGAWRGAAGFDAGALVGWRLSPCPGDASGDPDLPLLCRSRNGRAALAALHLQLQARVRGLGRLLGAWCGGPPTRAKRPPPPAPLPGGSKARTWPGGALLAAALAAALAVAAGLWWLGRRGSGGR